MSNQTNFTSTIDYNSLLAALFSALLFLGVLLLSKYSFNELTRPHFKTEIKYAKIEEEKAIKFLNKSASYYYKRGQYFHAMLELHLSYNIQPNRYEVNYMLAITLTGICKQQGLYCDEAIEKLAYLDKHWHMDQEWINQKYLELGIVNS